MTPEQAAEMLKLLSGIRFNLVLVQLNINMLLLTIIWLLARRR